MDYQPTTAYTQPPVFEQILVVVLFIVIEALHSVFVTSAAAVLDSAIMWALVGVSYGLVLLMIYDYLLLTCNDPVDDLVLKIERNYHPSQLKQCDEGCRCQVHVRSYHCKRCKRCVEYFDHHCKYLNNCIGGKNYYPFLRMLMAVTAYCLSLMGESVWLFLKSYQDETFNQGILSRWGILSTFLLSLVALLAVDSLLCFHFYLIFCLKSTTYDYIMNQPDSTQSDQPH